MHGIVRAVRLRPHTQSAADLTGASIELLARHGMRPDHPAIIRAASYLRASQRGDGSWDSATGARFLHGTTWALRGLVAAGKGMSDDAVAAGVNWLLVHQYENGGWGERVEPSAEESDFVAADATAIQTAWAVLALVATDHCDHDAARRGIEFLLDSQKDDGSWCDLQLTERDFALGWHHNSLHSAAVPLLALARWAVAVGHRAATSTPGLRLFSDDKLS
jgi:squalene-hopene/tetraprenyl-beta-curcumene cyclase